MEISSDGIGIMVIVLGSLLIVAGLALMVVIWREGTWWVSILKGALSIDLPDFGWGSMVPMFQQIVLGLMDRAFIYIRVGAIIGGAGVSTLGIVLIILGIYIMS